MELQKLTETVLLNFECLWVLQELDEGWRVSDPITVTLLERLYTHRLVSWKDVHPLLRLNTTLSLLIVPIAFAARLSDDELCSQGFLIRREYDVVCREKGQPCTFTPKEFLLVLRNALAHLPDFVSDDLANVNISFSEGILRCWSSNRSREVVFLTEDGFIEFLRDFKRLCNGACGSRVRDWKR